MKARALAFSFLGLSLVAMAASAQPPGGGTTEVVSGVKLDDPTKELIDKATGTYKITATGKVSLAKGHTWDGFSIEFKDKDDKTPTPTLVDFTVPAPGETKNFKYYVKTTTVGGWTIQAVEKTKNPVAALTDVKLINLP